MGESVEKNRIAKALDITQGQLKKIVKEMFFPEAFQKSETWAQDALQDLEDFIEEQGIYIRQ